MADTTFFPSQFSAALASDSVPGYITDPKARSEFARLEQTVLSQGAADPTHSAGFTSLSSADQAEFDYLRTTGTVADTSSPVSGLLSGDFLGPLTFGDLTHIYDEAGLPYGSGYDDAGRFVGASPNSNAPTSSHIVASRSLTPGSPNDTNPGSQLPISGRPVLTVPLNDGSGSGPAGGSGGPPQGSGEGSGTTATGSGSSSSSSSSGSSGSSSTSDQTILSQLIALAASQNSGGGGSGGGGLVALPTGISDSSTVAAPTPASSHTGAILLILLISGLAFWYYKKHKKAA